MYGQNYYANNYLVYFILPLLLAIYSNFLIKKAYREYRSKRSNLGLSGYEVANLILRNNNIYDIKVIRAKGTLTDHYDSSKKIIALSDEVYSGNSIASISIAAHEAGHAVQLAEGYLPLIIRHRLVGVTQFATNISFILILLGFFVAPSFGRVGIIAYFVIFIFQLVTLPVEFNASSRALSELSKIGANSLDLTGAQKMLKAAALTYVAATVNSLVELLRLINIFGKRRD